VASKHAEPCEPIQGRQQIRRIVFAARRQLGECRPAFGAKANRRCNSRTEAPSTRTDKPSPRKQQAGVLEFYPIYVRSK